MSSRVWVFGIGSPQGDDQLGWRVAEILQQRGSLEATALANPIDLCDAVGGCQQAVIVDSCIGGGDVGSVTQLDWPDDRLISKSRGSTHGVDVDYALRLASELGRLRAKVTLLLVEIASCEPDGQLSSAAAAVADNLADRIERQWQSLEG